jgi:histidine ammonia-lyase
MATSMALAVVELSGQPLTLDQIAHVASGTMEVEMTSGGKEDHVSMGMTAALKLRQIVENPERVLAIELMTAAQKIGLSHAAETGPADRSCQAGGAR